MDIRLPQHHLLKRLFLPHGMVLPPFLKTICPYRRGLFLGSPLHGLTCPSYASAMLFFLITLALKSERMRPPTLFFFMIVVAIWCPLRFYVNFRMEFSIYTNKQTNPDVNWIFIGIAFKSVPVTLVSIALLILSLPIYRHGMSFYLFVSSFISFSVL